MCLSSSILAVFEFIVFFLLFGCLYQQCIEIKQQKRSKARTMNSSLHLESARCPLLGRRAIVAEYWRASPHTGAAIAAVTTRRCRTSTLPPSPPSPDRPGTALPANGPARGRHFTSPEFPEQTRVPGCADTADTPGAAAETGIKRSVRERERQRERERREREDLAGRIKTHQRATGFAGRWRRRQR